MYTYYVWSICHSDMVFKAFTHHAPACQFVCRCGLRHRRCPRLPTRHSMCLICMYMCFILHSTIYYIHFRYVCFCACIWVNGIKIRALDGINGINGEKKKLWYSFEKMIAGNFLVQGIPYRFLMVILVILNFNYISRWGMMRSATATLAPPERWMMHSSRSQPSSTKKRQVFNSNFDFVPNDHSHILSLELSLIIQLMYASHKEPNYWECHPIYVLSILNCTTNKKKNFWLYYIVS